MANSNMKGNISDNFILKFMVQSFKFRRGESTATVKLKGVLSLGIFRYYDPSQYQVFTFSYITRRKYCNRIKYVRLYRYVKVACLGSKVFVFQFALGSRADSRYRN
jgi:hypothetical protein